jgi:acetylornithine deacetylase/succinyl-diaminopimelate desuccinylase-like protein
MTRAGRCISAAVLVWLALGRCAAAQDESAIVAALMKDPRVKTSLELARTSEPRTIEDQIRFCEIPAAPFKESARGEALRQTFQQLGLRNVRIDKAGNVLGDRPGAAPRPRVVLSAHLDTVFPEEIDVRVTREGSVLRGPGIGDDCRGLAVMVSTIRVLRQTNVQTPGTLTFVGTVGEEGLGDLRGVKQLFKETLAGEIDRFVSIDGGGLGVTNIGVGSVRYRVTFKGPGGHSYSAFGLANPIDALGRAIAKIADFQVPSGTTFNVGRIGGGTSINSIPAEAWMEVDMRSSAAAPLAALEARLQKAIDTAVAEENERWHMPRSVTVVKERVGYRPAGSTPSDSAIVRSADAVHRALGLPITFNESSTDANIPMSLHIPAITIGGGGRGTGAHAASESFDTAESWHGTERALLLVLALAQR